VGTGHLNGERALYLVRYPFLHLQCGKDIPCCFDLWKLRRRRKTRKRRREHGVGVGGTTG
jgi:hypothetical protein